MRAYHFMSERWALSAIRSNCLKLARLADMNDPFELLAIDLPKRRDRECFNALKDEMNDTIDLLCFSRSWSNPVLWSHYGDKHRGICLGFDIPDEFVKPVTYQGKRLASRIEQVVARHSNETVGYKLLTTKYEHWRYEDEVRLILKLKDVPGEGDHYFAPFGSGLRLREVITGHRCQLSSRDIRGVVESAGHRALITRGRLAFRTFTVVRNRAAQNWAETKAGE